MITSTGEDVSYACWGDDYLRLVELNRTDRNERWAADLAESDAAAREGAPWR